MVLLSTTYFGPVQWYQKLYRHGEAMIEVCESFQKQTYRNRCLIATAQGVQALTVPVEGSKANRLVADLHISDHGNWRHQHWQAITSAYGDSPFLEYYEDDLRPFFFEHQWERLVDFNDAIVRRMCELLDIHPVLKNTTEFERVVGFADYREAISPKHPLPDPEFVSRSYYQVFSQRHGFLPNLSILDLLLNMGPEAIYFL